MVIKQKVKKDVLKTGVTALNAFIVSASLACGAAAAAEAEDGWKFGSEIYLWGADVGLDTVAGDDIDISFNDLIDNLKLGGMATVVAQKNKWSIGSDIIYLDVKDDVNAPVTTDVTLDSVELEAWLVSPFAGYEIARSDRSVLRLYGGLRYLSLETTIIAKSSPPLSPFTLKENDTDNIIDGFIGLHGKTDINKNWYASYLADIGAGDSDWTFQGSLAINYRFNSFDFSFGYRYLKWELDSDLVDSLDFGGPFAGAKIKF
ncbi:hypothetical protein [Colwellia sp. MEBiC06753]